MIKNIFFVDSIFVIPLLTGLVLVITLSLLGGFLRMRNEWLSALGVSQIAATGAVLSIPLQINPIWGATFTAIIAMIIKNIVPQTDNNHYAIMILFGWASSILIASITHQGDVVGQTFLRGQLYFTNISHLIFSVILLFFLLISLKYLSKKLLTERLFPDFYISNNITTYPYSLLFSVLIVFGVVLGTVSLGSFPAFSVFFVPSLLGFAFAKGWKNSLILTVTLAVLSYVLSFYLAINFDYPFGPVLVMVFSFLSLIKFFY